MDPLDVIIIVILLAAAAHGLRLGAAVQVMSFLGGLVGLGLGIFLLIVTLPHLHGVFTRTFVSLLLLLVPATVTWGLGRQVGAKVWHRLRGRRLAAVDAGSGAIIAMAGALVIIWLLAAFLADSQVSVISSEIQNSRVVRFVSGVMPQVPGELASKACMLDQAGLPIPCIGIVAPVAPVAVARPAQVRAAVDTAGRSTVQIVAMGCGNVVVEGSGFVVAPGLVVTNAHVVAGASTISENDGVQSEPATPVLFDPNFDLAVLRVSNLDVPALPLDSGYVARGTKAVVLGYPGGGPFDAQAAGVLMRFDPESPNIYDTASTERQIYELQALVRPGNSGGPILEPDGEVIGVVFSRDSSNSEIGFALASPGVLQRVRIAEQRRADTSVGTGSCLPG
ncbi:MAG: MarP family serine protease [Acidimicrobiales bacterium]|jgi:S1-C subfamily serine protease